MGSGVRKLYKYCKINSGLNPQLIEEDIFKIIIPLDAQVGEQVLKILKYCKISRKKQEISDMLYPDEGTEIFHFI